MNTAPLQNAAIPVPVELELRDIHLPDAISWWPLAPGWWLSLGVIVLVLLCIYLLIKYHQGKQLEREITTELEKIKQSYSENGNRTRLAQSLSILLRRASLSYFSGSTSDNNISQAETSQNSAGLTGEHWLQWLDNSASLPDKFQSETGKVLLTAPYLPETSELDYDANALISLCENWLMTKHRPGVKRT